MSLIAFADGFPERGKRVFHRGKQIKLHVKLTRLIIVQRNSHIFGSTVSEGYGRLNLFVFVRLGWVGSAWLLKGKM